MGIFVRDWLIAWAILFACGVWFLITDKDNPHLSAWRKARELLDWTVGTVLAATIFANML